MSMTYLEELTIRTFVELGIPPNVLLRPPLWGRAILVVSRLLASDLDPSDSIWEEMPPDVKAQVLMVAAKLVELRSRYSQEGQAMHG